MSGEQSAARSVLPLGVSLPVAVLVGILTAVQARVNGALGAEIGNGFVAASISFGSGLVLIVALCVALPQGRAGLRRLASGIGRDIPVWMLLGGLAGAVTVATQGLTVATIGVALFTVGLVAGQTVGGLVLDRVGYGPGGVVAVTVPRVVGAALVLAGVTLCALGPGSSRAAVWMIVLPLLAGAGIAWQQGTNGRLRQSLGSPFAATAVNFASGTLVLVLAAVISVASSGMPQTFPAAPWLYLGGPLGVAYIVMSAAIVRHTGVLLLGLGSVVGLLTASIVLDAVAPATSAPALGVASLAAAVALVGVAVVVVPRRRRER